MSVNYLTKGEHVNRSVSVNYLTKGEHLDGEEEGSKHRALRNTLVDWSWGGPGVSNGEKLFPVC